MDDSFTFLYCLRRLSKTVFTIVKLRKLNRKFAICPLSRFFSFFEESGMVFDLV